MSSLFLDTLGDTLKQVNVDGTLSFYGIAIDSGLYERLTRSWVHIRSVTFKMSHSEQMNFLDFLA
ncbi:unnamed protein product [Anisakis simplex]|uniref:Alpha-1,4 glucan phosphorylase n=1 Tax=Anisakis simplex TaxID=6269 RepID=A0A0M3JKP9_ANISI|nr:unnamed protein product [Anisakis simplex]